MDNFSKPGPAGIPTEYGGITFRSRLEAKWAAFFDLAKWPWDYEPFDCDGWIPDFIIKGKLPLLVDVKPVSRIEECHQFGAKIAESRPPYPVAIFGTGLLDTSYPTIGIMVAQPIENHPWGPGAGWDMTLCLCCANPCGASFYTMFGGWHCAMCGEWCEHSTDRLDVWFKDAWAKAHQATKWVPK